MQWQISRSLLLKTGMELDVPPGSHCPSRLDNQFFQGSGATDPWLGLLWSVIFLST